ncbi:acylphosphatase-2-like [Chironomus tepperi]|uniref:acylphosphatase-2-like n=1 Tax=Chironomus tepperi TaxID=113505 RepID=UPI00391FA377
MLKIKSVFKISCLTALFVILCYIEGKFNLFSPNSEPSKMSGRRILACDFEVFGIVQGVFFRKHTEETGRKLGVRGWCMNTKDGTVKGQMEGEEGPLNQMKEWLSKTGSPSSRIDKAVFSEPKVISDFTYENFSIKRVR